MDEQMPQKGISPEEAIAQLQGIIALLQSYQQPEEEMEMEAGGGQSPMEAIGLRGRP